MTEPLSPLSASCVFSGSLWPAASTHIPASASRGPLGSPRQQTPQSLPFSPALVPGPLNSCGLRRRPCHSSPGDLTPLRPKLKALRSELPGVRAHLPLLSCELLHRPRGRPQAYRGLFPLVFSFLPERAGTCPLHRQQQVLPRTSSPSRGACPPQTARRGPGSGMRAGLVFSSPRFIFLHRLRPRGGLLSPSDKRTDLFQARCWSSCADRRGSRAIRGAASSKDMKDACSVNSFAYIPARISPLGRMGCHKFDRRSTTGVEGKK